MLKHLAISYASDEALRRRVSGLFSESCGVVEVYMGLKLTADGRMPKKGACEVDKYGAASGFYVLLGTRDAGKVPLIQKTIDTHPWFITKRAEKVFDAGDFVAELVKPGQQVGYIAVPEKVPGVS